MFRSMVLLMMSPERGLELEDVKKTVHKKVLPSEAQRFAFKPDGLVWTREARSG